MLSRLTLIVVVFQGLLVVILNGIQCCDGQEDDSVKGTVELANKVYIGNNSIIQNQAH